MPSSNWIHWIPVATFHYYQGVTKRCRLSLLTNSALVIRVQMRGEGRSYGVSANEQSCAHHVTWSSNKLWRSTFIFNLRLLLYVCGANHRVDRVLDFFSSRPNWDPLTPSPAGFGSGGWTLSLAGVGWGGSQFGRGDTHCCTLGIDVFCDVNTGDDLYHLGRSHCDFRGVNQEQKNIFQSLWFLLFCFFVQIYRVQTFPFLRLLQLNSQYQT